MDIMAVTNEKGEFALTSDKPGLSLGIQVDARGLSRRIFSFLEANETIHELTLTYGATVTGKVLKEKKPLPGVFVGLVQTGRNSESFLGEWSVATNDEGRFEIPNVAPNCECVIYAKIDSPGLTGAVPVKTIQVGAVETVVDAGTLEVVPGHGFSGRIVLSDGNPVPPNTKVMISRGQAWDWTQVTVDGQGAFEARNLPSEEYKISYRIPGYHMSELNLSLDPLNQDGLMGMIEEDISGLTILMEPGDYKWKQSDSDAGNRYSLIKSQPIRGAKVKE